MLQKILGIFKKANSSKKWFYHQTIKFKVRLKLKRFYITSWNLLISFNNFDV